VQSNNKTQYLSLTPFVFHEPLELQHSVARNERYGGLIDNSEKTLEVENVSLPDWRVPSKTIGSGQGEERD